jgi:hypothetical protein
VRTDKVESSPKALKSNKKDSSDEGSTDEQMALFLRNFTKFMKKKYYKKGGVDKKIHHKEGAMSAKKWSFTLPIAHN